MQSDATRDNLLLFLGSSSCQSLQVCIKPDLTGKVRYDQKRSTFNYPGLLLIGLSVVVSQELSPQYPSLRSERAVGI